MSTPLPSRRIYLFILSAMAAGCMIFQIAMLRELRFQLNTIFTLAPFLFSSVIFFLGMGSLAARWVKVSLHRVLRWGVAILPLALIPAFAVAIALATVYSPLQPIEVTGDQYLSSVITAFALVSLLGFGPATDATVNLSQTGNLREAAANLFAMLRGLDRAEFTAIAVMPIPEMGLGRAINDRLRRAAAPRN